MLQQIKNIFGKRRESQDSPATSANEALTRGRNARQEDAQGHTYTSAEPAPR